MVKAMARTYLMYTQGTPITNTFNMDTSDFKASWTVDTSIEKPTQIYYSSEYYYPNDVQNMSISHAGVALTDEQYAVSKGDTYIIFDITDAALNGKQVDFSMTA